MSIVIRAAAAAISLALLMSGVANAQEKTQKPPLHGSHWMAITGKPLAATAGARMFERGGNAVDAACAMLAATSTMWDVLSWGGETQALIYHPKSKKIIAINGLGVAPTGATTEFYRGKGHEVPARRPARSPRSRPERPARSSRCSRSSARSRSAKCSRLRLNSPMATQSTPRRRIGSKSRKGRSSSGRIRRP